MDAERKVILPGDDEWTGPLWTPPSHREAEAEAKKPARPNRAQRRAWARAQKRRNDGSAKR